MTVPVLLQACHRVRGGGGRKSFTPGIGLLRGGDQGGPGADWPRQGQDRRQAGRGQGQGPLRGGDGRFAEGTRHRHCGPRREEGRATRGPGSAGSLGE